MTRNHVNGFNCYSHVMYLVDIRDLEEKSTPGKSQIRSENPKFLLYFLAQLSLLIISGIESGTILTWPLGRPISMPWAGSPASCMQRRQGIGAQAARSVGIPQARLDCSVANEMTE